MHRALTLVALSVAHAEVFVSSFRQQLGNANAALVQCAFPYAIRHGCILRLADNIEEDELNVARAYGKYNGHSPSDQVVPLVERFFDFTRGQPEPPACNRTGSARDWYLKRHEQGSGACGLQPPPSVHEAAEATRAVHRVFGINSTHAFGRDCRAAPPYLAAHVRSGDVFQGNWDKDGGWMPGKVHPDYGQPVLSYYVQCVAAARRDGVQRMIVVCEDFRNPVCLALRTMAPLVDGLSVRRLPLLETLQTLGCASRVCKAVGSFSSISQNSYHNRIVTAPNKTDVHFPVVSPARVIQTKDTNQVPRPSHDGELWQSRDTSEWTNTCLQREGMLLRYISCAQQ